MPLITRQEKGSKLTIQEMDGNLEYLQSNGFIDGTYTQSIAGTGSILSSENISIKQTAGAAVGTYTVSPVGGSGSGATFELILVDAGKVVLESGSVIDGGSGYRVGDVLEIPTDMLGGSKPSVGTWTFTLGEGSVSASSNSEITVSPTSINIKSIQGDANGEIINLRDLSCGDFVNATEGTYTVSPLPGSTTKGNGLILEIVVIQGVTSTIELPTYTIDFSSSNIVSPGSGYSEDDVIVFSTDQLGGSDLQRGTEIQIRLAEGSVSTNIETSIEVSSNLIILSGLPTEDPGVAGALWVNMGVLSVSTGIVSDPL